jgi:putative ABC transport system permease protein
MSFVRTIAKGSLLRRPGRTLFSILGVAIGIVTVVGVFTLDHNTVVGMTLRGADEWRPALEVRPGRDVSDPRSELVATPGVAGVSAIFQNQATVRSLDNSSSESDVAEGAMGRRAPGRSSGRTDRRNVRLIALDADSIEAIDAVRLVAGRMIATGAEDAEILVGAPLATDLGLDVGSKLALSRPRRAARKDCIDGELRVAEETVPVAVPPEHEFTVVGVLAEQRLGRRSKGQVVIVDFPRGREVFTGRRVEPRFWVHQSPDVDIERLRASLGRTFSYDLNKAVIVGAAADERAFRNGVRMAGLLALILGLYVIFHTLSMSLVERVREVGTLHALGTTRAQIARVFLAEAVIVSGSAGVLGLTGGLVLARLLSKLGITTLGTGHWFTTFSIPWSTVIALTLLGVSVALIGSVYPLMRARHANTVEALRGEEALETSNVTRGFHLFAALLLVVLLPALYFVIVPVVGALQGALVGTVLLGVGFLALLVVLPLIVPSLLGFLCVHLAKPFERLAPLSGQLAARAMRDSPARIAVAAAAIALVAASFVGLKGMTASLRGEIEAWADGSISDKVFVRNLPNVSLERLEGALATYPEVLGIESGSVRHYGQFLLIGLESEQLARYGPCKEDPALIAALEEGRGVILSQRVARHLDYQLGDPVNVDTGGGVEELEVVAVSDAYGYFPAPDERLYGVTSAAFMKRAFCIETGTTDMVGVQLRPGADPGVVEAAIAANWPEAPINYVTGASLVEEHLRDIARDFRLFDIILGLTAVLAGLGVLNGQLLAALERAKELGVLKALGADRRQVAGAVLLASLVVGVLGGALGTGLGAALTPLIVRVIDALSGLAMPLRYAGPWLVWVPVGALFLTLLASLYPIWRMNRLDPVAAVRTG